MPRDQILDNLYTVAVSLNHGDLPSNFLSDWYHPQEVHETAHCYVSVNSRLIKKCIFIESEELANQLVSVIKEKMTKRIPSICFTIRKVQSGELDYRRKKALKEAQENTVKILGLN
jgi:hypothetical protein